MIEAEEVVKKALGMGADEVAVSIARKRGYRVEVELNDIKSSSYIDTAGVSITVIIDKKIATVSTTLYSLHDLDNVLDEALRLAKSSERNEKWRSLPEPEKVPTVEDIYDSRVASFQPEDIVEIVTDAVNHACSIDERIIVQSGSFETVESTVEFATSSGHRLEGRSTLVSTYFLAWAKEGSKIGSFSYDEKTSRKLDIDARKVSENAAKMALDSLNSRKIESFKGTIILDGDALAQIIGTFAQAYKADTVWKGSSPLKGKIGEKVVSEKLTIIDNGVMPGGVHSFPFDAEGTGRRKTVVVEKGVLKKYLSNTYTARLLGIEATGNAASLLDVGLTNTYIKPGDSSLEEILSNIRKGLLVKRFSGDVRFQDGVVSGVTKQSYYIEDGEIKYPAQEAMISDNLYSLLAKVALVGSVVEYRFGIYSPIISFEDVNIMVK
ncbi:MAG: hypothetical protein DRJ35_06225 [Thermoprotei archaeon]|nr:MAG: hypothetical protein DRJ35_06225 [Thermoprotei archaeon]